MTAISRLIRNQIYIKPSKIHGYGVFADVTIQPGEIIEECYALQLEDSGGLLHDFFYRVEGKPWLALGYGSLYNHSSIPNASIEYDIEESLLVFIAAQLIKKDEEILVFYGKNWFGSRKKKVKELFWRHHFRKHATFFWLLTRIAIILVLLYLVIHFI